MFCSHGRRRKMCGLCKISTTAAIEMDPPSIADAICPAVPKTDPFQICPAVPKTDAFQILVECALRSAFSLPLQEDIGAKLVNSSNTQPAAQSTPEEVCSRSSLCRHGSRKSTCKSCGGTSICSHGRRRYRCRDCKGGQICSHGKVKSRCAECGGGEAPELQTPSHIIRSHAPLLCSVDL